ncbi:MAG: transposase [Candidatus Desantisbacteria bacterium]
MSAPRLENFDYIGYRPYSITICCDCRHNYFESDIVVNECIKILRDVSEEYEFKVYLYTFMPDHLHLSIVGSSENANLQKMIKIFKQKCGFWFKKEYGKQLFQSGYYDHIVRKEEGIEKVIRYMANNPVRKGLCENYEDYRFTSSFEFDMKKMF